MHTPPSSRRGLTLTELLTVVSVITILTTMMSPVLIRLRQEGHRIKCLTNLGEITKGLSLIANQQNGKLPKCFEMNGTQVNEDTWWFHKVARVLYPTDTVGGTFYDQLTVPRNNDSSFWNGNVGRLQRFQPDRCVLRCPASRDNYWDYFAPGAYNKVSTSSATGSSTHHRAKDRVYDDCYGYNNHGGSETIGGAAKRYGFQYQGGYGDPCTVHFQDHHDNYFGTDSLYHNRGSWRHRNVRGTYYNEHPRFSYLGALADVGEASETLVIADYIKAHISPTIDDEHATTRGDGYVFRHGGKLNALFVDGHAEAYRETMFRRAIADGAIHWTVYRP